MILLLAACSGPSVRDEATALAEALARLDDPPAALAACERLAGPSAIDCRLAVAAHADLDVGRRACAGLSDPVWREECAFVAAEHLAIADAAVAAPLCLDAGRFAPRCLDHLWRAHAARVDRDAFAAATAWGEAAGVPPADAWVAWWDARRPPGPVDLGACGDDATCRDALPEVLRRALLRSEDGADGAKPLDFAALCGDGPLADRVLAASAVAWAPEPALDAVAERFAERACRRWRLRGGEGSRVGPGR